MVKVTSVCLCLLIGLVVLFDSWAEASCAKPCLITFFKCVRGVNEGCCTTYEGCMKESCGSATVPCDDSVGKRASLDRRGSWNKRGSWDKRGSWNKRDAAEEKRGSWNKRAEDIELSQRGSWNKRAEAATEEYPEAILRRLLLENYGTRL